MVDESNPPTVPISGDALPAALYGAAQVREFDRVAIEECGIPGGELMAHAGAAAFALLRARWPAARRLAVLCGSGNNGGDGYVVARLARAAGLEPEVLRLGDPARLAGAAADAAAAWHDTGGRSRPFTAAHLDDGVDVVIDGLLGTGLERPVTGTWAEAVAAVNAHPAPVLALDIPSGLDADRGGELGSAVRADATVSFIALKAGLFTGAGPDCCGAVHFADLEVPNAVFADAVPRALLLGTADLAAGLAPRARTAHKGEHGHLLVIGGNLGMMGAVQLAACAALRAGAGRVSVATRPEHVAALTAVRPELMCHGVSAPRDLAPLLAAADAVAIGPGLGRDAWGRGLFAAALDGRWPLVVDADALRLLAAAPERRDDWLLTPHPGEAAALLGTTTAALAADRFAAVAELQRRFGGIAVLKGAGTLVAGDAGPPRLCRDGNPGLATAGSGDVLTGIAGALRVQGVPAGTAAGLAVLLHARAGDIAARDGERGLLASDLLVPLRALVNMRGA